MKKLILVFIFFTLFSCNKKNEDQIETKFIVEQLGKVNLEENIEWVVILPGLGCRGCIVEGENFMKEYIHKKNILFILTSIESLKVLQHKTQIILDDHENVLIDSKGDFIIPTQNMIYPCIVQLEDRKVVSLGFQSPDSKSSFFKLKSIIDTGT